MLFVLFLVKKPSTKEMVSEIYEKCISKVALSTSLSVAYDTADTLHRRNKDCDKKASK
jgi:hypothetical protein